MANLRRTVVVSGVIAALAAGLLGCTSDDPTEVGDSLATTRADTTLAPLALTTIQRWGQQLVADTDVRPVIAQDLLYLGDEDGETSAVLVNFSFAAFGDSTIGDNDQVTPEMVATENISSVRLRLLVPCFYRDPTVCAPDSIRVPDPGLRKYYEVYRLLEPFDANAEWPGAIPPYDPVRLNNDASYEDDRDTGLEPAVEITLYAADFVAWVQGRERVGLLIVEGSGREPSDPGIKGFSSRNNRFPGSRLPCPCEQITERYVGPTLRCTFNSNVAIDPNLWNIECVEDVSTFHRLDDPPQPDDALVLRTHVRSYPALSFDLSRIPPNALINAAVLVVVNDTTLSYGNLQDVVVAEYDTLNFGGGIHAITLSQLDAATDYVTTAAGALDPETRTRLNLIVTSTVQRYINQVEDMKPSFVLTAGESFLPPSASGSDYWLSLFRFFGSANPDSSLRPRLEITYSVVNELEEGAHD